MALIKCSECGNDVSDKARACPKCGNPIAATTSQAPAAVAVTAAPVTAIEQTGKEYKAQMLAASILAGLGIAVMFTGGAGVAVGFIMMVGGVGWYTAARFGAWWHHG